jgi:hypothetical protein
MDRKGGIYGGHGRERKWNRVKQTDVEKEETETVSNRKREGIISR